MSAASRAVVLSAALPGYDPDDPLAAIKTTVKETKNEEMRPGAVAAVIEQIAMIGMDAGTEASIRAYLKAEKSIGLGAAQFDRIVKEARRARKRAVSSASSPPDSSAGDAHLHIPPALASEQDILKLAVGKLRVCRGLVGENRNAKLVYLAVASRLLDKQVSIVIKGLSSSGKSYVIQCVLWLFPAEAVFTMTAMSERALIYLDEELAHRTVVLYEATALREGREKAEDNQTAYIVRSLLSEGRIEYPTVVRQEDGSLKTEKLVKEGPTNLVTSTTSISLHPENETRMLSLPSNDSQAQTRAVMLGAASDAPPVADDEAAEWIAYQRWLACPDCASRRVVIPFARCIAAQIPPVAVRLRRDWNTIRSLIETHAMMHQLNRKKDDAGRVIAVIDDYQAIRSLVADVVAEGIGSSVPASVTQTVEAVGKLGSQDGDGDGVTVTALAAELGIERSAAQRRLTTAHGRGYLVNKEDKRGKAARYVLGEQLPGNVAVLPEPGDVCTPGRTPSCTHLAGHAAAGQGCDCTGVCRCANSADPTGGDGYDPRPEAEDEVPIPPQPILPADPSAASAHLHRSAACPRHSKRGPHSYCPDCKALASGEDPAA